MPGVSFQKGAGIFLFAWLLEALTSGVKRPGREADQSSPSSAEIKKAWSYTSIPQYVFMTWCLVKYRIYLYGMVLS
jgi:hypothetical protein